ncbi:GIY-YIG nuclease family protein [Flavobacterium sp. MXW15]|uniref:GIY-YIG nuclease family protein n=1 Tax=Xanthomonas chitinilytica TaxID=2989819 RepID=A0ABT3JW71_9XANT|nr:GIY-YIG nuclease family protein [Xanthomonas sp. H13-6]MCW4455111.1 GIY-YIG nuclease family protein [Flavobacterium sp. MXW15]MCW4472723.1 GIY-YIG nuclease family protein [Xanthomonas sp. H13-6]
MLELNDLLAKAGIDPKQVMVMRHRPTEKELRAVLPWLAAERHEVYNAYQSQHGPKVEAALAKARYLASFIGHAPGRAVFVGLYEVAGHRRVAADAFWTLPGNAELRELGTRGPQERDPLWFELLPTEQGAALKGRLVIEWSGIERSWWRWAARNVLPVQAIHEESLLVKAMPDWQTLALGWRELQLLPASWRQALAQWRGIYFIFDRAARLGYVGSASGGENLLGRWLDYAASGDGGNRLLRGRNPEDFVFSILQRVSPDLPAEDIVPIENAWKERLHTRAPYGLNDN